MAKNVCGKEAKMANSLNCVDLDKASSAVCYPRPVNPPCSRLMEELKRIGIECLIDYGPTTVSGYHVLGKGWAGIVFLSEWKGRIVAVKVLRTDSRRHSLVWEAIAWDIAASLGVAPELFHASPYFIVAKAILGQKLDNYRPSNCNEAVYVVRRLLFKAWLLDKVGLLHNELARPGSQILLDGLEPFIVDYESSTLRRGRGRTNLTQLAGGLAKYAWVKECIPGLVSHKVRTVLAKYKRLAHPDLRIFEEVLDAIREPDNGGGV